MKRFRKPVCPYCGDKLGFVKAWVLRRRGEYICPKCKGLSNVHLDPAVYGLGFLAIVIGAVFFTVGLVLDFNSIYWTVPGEIVPFLLFYLFSVNCIRLKKPAPPRRPQSRIPRDPTRRITGLQDIPPAR